MYQDAVEGFMGVVQQPVVVWTEGACSAYSYTAKDSTGS